MDYSLPGLLGAVAGTAVGVVNYALTVPLVQRALRARDTSATAAEREAFEGKLSLMRRLILGLDVLGFAAIGYWLSDWAFR
jgi:hypothetical protein